MQPFLHSTRNISIFTATPLILFACLFHPSNSQAVPDDSIVFTTQAGWNDMRACAKCPLQFNAGFCNIGYLIVNIVGCETNACLCRASTLGEAIDVYSDEALELCSNYDDQRTATSFLSQYCADKGYTSIDYGNSNVASKTTGAYTTTATVTMYSFATVTLSSSGSRMIPAPFEGPVVLGLNVGPCGLLSAIVASLIPVIWWLQP